MEQIGTASVYLIVQSQCSSKATRHVAFYIQANYIIKVKVCLFLNIISKMSCPHHVRQHGDLRRDFKRPVKLHKGLQNRLNVDPILCCQINLHLLYDEAVSRNWTRLLSVI